VDIDEPLLQISRPHLGAKMLGTRNEKSHRTIGLTACDRARNMCAATFWTPDPRCILSWDEQASADKLIVHIGRPTNRGSSGEDGVHRLDGRPEELKCVNHR
jgi:hypothetical protein